MTSVRTRCAAAATLAVTAVLASAPASGAEPPPNDAIENAIFVPAVPYSDTLNTAGATTAASDTGCDTFGTVWYAFTAAVNEPLVASTVGSDYDTAISIFSGTPGDLTFVTCADDNVIESPLNEYAYFDAVTGVTYYIQVSSFGIGDPGDVAAGGNLVFSLTPAPPPLNARLTVRSLTLREPHGSVRIRGTATCNIDADGYVNTTLRQRQGQRIVEVGTFSDVVCRAGELARWEPSSHTPWGPGFLPKQTTVETSWILCAQFTCDSDVETSTRRIELRPNH